MHRARQHERGVRCDELLRVFVIAGVRNQLRCACLSRPATCSHMPWQAARSDEIAGRDDGGNALLLQGAQAPNPHLFILTRPPIGHACAAGTRLSGLALPGCAGALIDQSPLTHARRRVSRLTHDRQRGRGRQDGGRRLLRRRFLSRDDHRLGVPRWLKKVLCPFAVLCEAVRSLCGSKVKNRLLTCLP